MLEFIQNNFTGAVICLTFIVFLLLSRNFTPQVNALFLCATVSTLLLLCCDAWQVLPELPSSPLPLRCILRATSYLLRCIVPYFIVIISLRGKQTRKINFLLALPLLAEAAVAYLSAFTGIAFSFDAANQLVKGPLYFLPFLIAGFYLIFLAVNTVVNYMKGNTRGLIFLIVLVFLLVIAVVLETLSDGKLHAILSSLCAFCLVFYYLLLYQFKSIGDRLTGCLGRRQFFLDAKSASLTAVIALDLNGLKYINDTHGHAEGDEALAQMAEAVRKVLPKNAVMYRIGGDEFSILCRRMKEEEVQALLEQIRDAMKSSDYTWASGYAMYRKKNGFEATCLMADAAMYENKAAMRQDALHYFRQGALSMD